jgi:hypothetical protein
MIIQFEILKKKENMGLFLIGGPSKHYDWDTKIGFRPNKVRYQKNLSVVSFF